MTFKDYALHDQIHLALESLGFSTPTPVQEKAIPLVLEKKDVISLAETGSGKTAAYLIPALNLNLQEQNPLTLILCPTRELAAQIGEVIRDLTKYSKNIYSAVIIGGGEMSKQIRALKRQPQFIVATPGRLMDHVRQRTVDLRNVSTLILDEADRMFDMGFAPQVNEIVRFTAKERQTLLFSATFPKEVRNLASRILRNPVEVEVRKNSHAPLAIDQRMIEVTQQQKNESTLDLINAAKGSVVVFTRTKSRTDRLTRFLEQYGVKVVRIHGDRSQGQRNRAIQDFRSGQARVLVSTDLAARGLDVPGISDVINYDVPMCAEDYIHRVGRTGRAGQSGQAATMVTPEDKNQWYYIAKKIGMPVPPGASNNKPMNYGKPSNRNGSGNGNRKGNGSRNGSGKPSQPGGPRRFGKPSFKKQNSGSVPKIY